MTVDTFAKTQLKTNWPHVGAFLGLTFGLTYLLDLVIYLRGGLGTASIVTVLQFQMLLPAFSAILLGFFFFPESPIYRSRQAGKGRWFYFYFIGLTVVYGLGVLALWLVPAETTNLLAAIIPEVLSFLGLVVLIVLRRMAGREGMHQVQLGAGNWRYWLVFGLGFVTFYVIQIVLNALLGLGRSTLAPNGTPPGLSPVAFLVVGAVQSVLVGSFLGIIIAFGEEYGWRGYLQNELVKLGRVRGILLLGVIWGAWHWPLILMGYNYPGYPLLGLVLMVLYTTGLAVVLGFVFLKTGSVLLTAFLHAVNDQVAAFLVAMGFAPFNNTFSFGIGIYGLITLAIIALLFLRDPIWKGNTPVPVENNNPSQV
jgi:membrane protease YdiL (CAAX protease family)